MVSGSVIRTDGERLARREQTPLIIALPELRVTEAVISRGTHRIESGRPLGQRKTINQGSRGTRGLVKPATFEYGNCEFCMSSCEVWIKLNRTLEKIL